MRYHVTSFPVKDPLNAVRREFERGMGVQTDSASGLTVTETAENVRIALDLPGVVESDINISVQEGCLSISGERKGPALDSAELRFSNQLFGEFQRTLKLHDSIDPHSVDAVLENGVLTITMSRRPELQPRRVTIRQATT